MTSVLQSGLRLFSGRQGCGFVAVTTHAAFTGGRPAAPIALQCGFRRSSCSPDCNRFVLQSGLQRVSHNANCEFVLALRTATLLLRSRHTHHSLADGVPPRTETSASPSVLQLLLAAQRCDVFPPCCNSQRDPEMFVWLSFWLSAGSAKAKTPRIFQNRMVFGLAARGGKAHKPCAFLEYVWFPGCGTPGF